MRNLYLSIALSFGLIACGADDTSNAPETDQKASTLQSDYPTKLQKIVEGVWVHTSTYTFPGGDIVPSNGLIVEEEDGLILVDTAWGEMATASLLLAGVDILERNGVEVISHPDTARLSALKGTPLPNSSVSALATAPSRAKFGMVEVAYPGHGHTKDNLVVYVPSAKVLFAGSLIRGGDQKALGNSHDADLTAWKNSLGWTKATYKEAKWVVPGHGKGGNLSLLDMTFKLVSDKLAETENAPTEKSKNKTKAKN